MLDICEDFATSHCMLFSTDPDHVKSKSKCMFFSRDQDSSQITNVKLNGDLLNWVSKAKHLGNYLSSKLNFSCQIPETKTDLLCKRAILFDKVHQIQQQFGFYHPRLVVKLLSIYSTALYGSCLWQLASDEHLKLNRSWNTALKIIWDLPHPTHTRYLESLSPVPHLEAVLMGRYIGFIENLAKSQKSLLKLIFNSCSMDKGSLTGQNVAYLLQKYGKLSVAELTTDKQSIKVARVYPLQRDEFWKIAMIEEITLLKKGLVDIDFDLDNLTEILEHICTE